MTARGKTTAALAAVTLTLAPAGVAMAGSGSGGGEDRPRYTDRPLTGTEPIIWRRPAPSVSTSPQNTPAKAPRTGVERRTAPMGTSVPEPPYTGSGALLAGALGGTGLLGGIALLVLSRKLRESEDA